MVWKVINHSQITTERIFDILIPHDTTSVQYLQLINSYWNTIWKMYCAIHYRKVSNTGFYTAMFVAFVIK